MPEIEKCALCGYSPMHLIRDGIDKISCCGMMCDVLRWNYVQRSISSEKELLVQVKALEEARRESILQIEYMHGKFQETGSGNSVLARLKALEVACQK